MKKILIWLVLIFCCALFDCFLVKKLPFSSEITIDPVLDQRICDEIKYFPIASNRNEAELPCQYVDSWMAERTFGGNRHHEGTDLMTTENERGIYPLVSMTDGVIEALGWLRLGGYRIGIRSSSGIYYYYAHMESYAEDLTEGSIIKAGQFLGFVGDTGYGAEGTIGQFAVHLHVGIYVQDANGEDVAVNAYPYLKKAESKQILADYKKLADFGSATYNK